MLMISNASFISGSARGLYDFGGGDSSAEVDKLLVQSHKAGTEAKKSKTIPMRLSRLAASSALALLLPGCRGCLFHSFL
jgi:hypothetical protein